jgi:hypothetical protein
MVQVCLREAGNEKKAFTQAYLALNPTKSVDDARKYWWIFDKNVWSKIKSKREENKVPNLFGD